MDNVFEVTSGTQFPLWLDHSNGAQFSQLTKDLITDVCIIGGGIAGITAAYCLLKAGKKVVLIEDGRLQSGESGRTTAHLTNVLDDRYFNIINVFGEEHAKLAAESHAMAINFIEKVVQEENIDCDFARVKGYLFPAKEDDIDILEKEFAATTKIGLQVKHLKTPPAGTIFKTQCLEFENQAQFHPGKYIFQLAKIITDLNGEIYELTHAASIDEEKLLVKTSAGNTIQAQQIIQATNVPFKTDFLMHTKQGAYRSYAIAFAIPDDAISTALFWDTADPYHYIRLQKPNAANGKKQGDDTVLIVGGEDHRTGVNPKTDPFAALTTWVRKHIPMATKVLYQWSGQIIEPVDYLSFIGLNPSAKNHSYIITGGSGNGMTHGTMSALLLTDIITKGSSEWENIYDPKRKHFSTIKEFLSNNLQSSIAYLKFLNMRSSDAHTPLKPGEGKIITSGLSKEAHYKDLDGNTHTFSAVCPHKQALLEWNAIEKTWDCAAHGSRFSALGIVVNGPAACNLKCIK